MPVRHQSQVPNVRYDDMFGHGGEGLKDDAAHGALYVSPTKTDMITYVDTKLEGHALAYYIRCKNCTCNLRIYSDVDRPMTKIKCDCQSRLLRDIETMSQEAINDAFEFKILLNGEQWPVKIDRLTAPSGMKYTGTRMCTKDEAIPYFLAGLEDSRKHGFRAKDEEEGEI